MRWFTNLRTMMKLLTGFGAVTIILAVVGTSGLSQMAEIKRKVHDINTQSVEAVTSLHRANLEIEGWQRDIARAAGARDAEDIITLAGQAQDRRIAFLTNITGVEKAARSEVMKDGVEALRAGFEEYLAELAALSAAARAGDVAVVDASGLRMNDIIRDLGRRFEEIARITEAEAESTMMSAERAYGQSQMSMLILIGTGILLSVVIGVAIGRMVSNPMVEATAVLRRMAQGDFTGTLAIETGDEVGLMARSLNKAIGDVSGALRDVRLSAYAVSGASNELSSASQDISTGAQEQASSIEESAASLEHLTDTIRENADRAQQASLAALTSRDVAEKGGEAAQHAVAAMGDINKASNRISEIVTAIDEIAFQTNLLALNAAVEAARAGEQGRGFAVVAAEVRNLAQRSATAAREIKDLIADSVHQIEQGTELVTQSGETLQAIIVSVKQVSDLVADIASASRDQAAGIEQVNRAVAQMDQITQSNAAQTEELSGTAETLSAQAQHMRALVSRFRLDADEDSWEVAEAPSSDDAPRDESTAATSATSAPSATTSPSAPADVPGTSPLLALGGAPGDGSEREGRGEVSGYDPDDPLSVDATGDDSPTYEEV